ncbi:MAG: CAP domain-containing protein [Chitinophagales bacterium]
MKKLVILFIVSLQLTVLFANQYTLISDEDFFTLPEVNQVIHPDYVDASIIEAGVFHNTNQYRASKGLNPLTYNYNLQLSATIHSTQMYQHDFFNHTNKYNSNYKDLDDRADAASYTDYSELAENIYYGYIDLNDAMTYAEIIEIVTQDFMASKGHNETLLTPSLEEFGCGVVFENKIKDGYWQFYLTESFGTQF